MKIALPEPIPAEKALRRRIHRLRLPENAVQIPCIESVSPADEGDRFFAGLLPYGLCQRCAHRFHGSEITGALLHAPPEEACCCAVPMEAVHGAVLSGIIAVYQFRTERKALCHIEPPVRILIPAPAGG